LGRAVCASCADCPKRPGRRARVACGAVEVGVLFGGVAAVGRSRSGCSLAGWRLWGGRGRGWGARAAASFSLANGAQGWGCCRC
jgi:hypothetical protein